MNFMIKFWLTLGLAVLLCSPARAEPGETALGSLLNEFLAGASVNDATMHDRFWSEDLIYTSSAGQRFGKAQIMQGLAEAEPAGETTTYGAEEVTIQIHGDVAVVTFRLIADMPDESRAEYFNTGVFRLQNKQWRAFVWQATRAAE
jgi:ketosteroid isomerase-like protein